MKDNLIRFCNRQFYAAPDDSIREWFWLFCKYSLQGIAWEYKYQFIRIAKLIKHW